VLLAVVLYGFRADRMLLQNSGWSPVGRSRLIHYTEIFGAASLAIWLIIPSTFAPLIALLAVVATAIAIGPLALLAVAAFLISACALGSKLLRTSEDPSPENQLCATLLGMAVYIFLMTFMARLPVNYPVVYAILLAVPVMLDIRGVGRRLWSWVETLLPYNTRPRPQVAAFMLLVFVLGMHWLIVPQPESSADGLAMHLAIPTNIALHHVFTYRPGHIFWSVMPMGADWCYTMVYLLGGEFAARLLNFAMLLLVEALLYRAVRRFVSPAVGFVILALFASTSLVQLVTGWMFIENFLAAMVVGMAVAIWQFGDTGQRRYLYAAAVLAGTALATKLGGLAFVAAALPVAALEVRRLRLAQYSDRVEARVGQDSSPAAGLQTRCWRDVDVPRRRGRLPHAPTLGSNPILRTSVVSRPALSSGIAVVLLLAAALPTYAISWWMTGDPVYPFLNRTFPSPLVDRNLSFQFTRFTEPIAFRTPYDLTFHSDRYSEGRPGYLGFQGLLLVPLGLIALPAVRRRPALSAAVVSIGGALIVLKFQPNARYLYPSLPLMLVPLAALLGWLAPGVLRRALIALAVACVVLNTWFLPSSNFDYGDFYEQAPLSRGMRWAYIHKHAPIREIGQYMNRAHPGSAVFLADGSELSAFNAEVYSNGWHEYNVFARIWYARDPLEIVAILDRWNVHYIVAPKPEAHIKIEPPALKSLLDNCVTPEYQATRLFLARIENSCEPAGRANREPLIALSGIYDDTDPAIVYRGPWIQDNAWPQTYSQTVTYSNLPGSEVRFAFRGGLLSYVYTKAANRGMADVAIDGVSKATLDLYAPKPEWQSRTYFKVGAGQHLAVITVLPGKNRKSSDRFIDLDKFEVQ